MTSPAAAFGEVENIALLDKEKLPDVRDNVLSRWLSHQRKHLLPGDIIQCKIRQGQE